jgi:hypothetical protein
MTPRQREEEQEDDEKLERQIELAKIRPVWVGDNGYVPKPRPREERRVKQFRPRA